MQLHKPQCKTRRLDPDKAMGRVRELAELEHLDLEEICDSLSHVGLDPKKVLADAQEQADVLSCTLKDALEMMLDCRHGMWETREIVHMSDYAYGLVIGENPNALFREKGDAHVTIPQIRQKLGLPREPQPDRYRPPFEMPRFGDIVLFYQKAAVDWYAMEKVPCATTLARKADNSLELQFFISNQTQDRWITIPRLADVTTIELGDVLEIARRFEGERANDSRTEHTGDGGHTRAV